MHGNAQAFGFSITITVTFGVTTILQPPAGELDLLAFALAGVAAFSILNLVVALLLRDEEAAESERAILLGTATDFVAVAAGVGVAIGVNHLLEGIAAWLLSPFGAGAAYVIVQSFELALGQYETDG
ncbi:MAG: hypothetical protein L0H25_09535 [Micrococcales bacterium]|nr:hypothetical protein [Micrococcales bacterium]